MLGKPRRVAILCEGRFSVLDAKTAIGLLRYRRDEVAAVIDSACAGRTAGECVGVGGDVPVVAGVDEAAARGADALVVGVAPVGGDLPPAYREHVVRALQRGWDVIAGLHAFLADDPELSALAARHGGALLDVRRVPETRTVATRRAAGLGAHVVLTVGSDCNTGKMTTAVELVEALRARGAGVAFVATGQTGMLIADRGLSVDRVVSDFVAGVVEELVLEAADGQEFVVVEGQGSLIHPGYSGVTLALLHGACPRSLVLCHQPSRTAIRHGGVPIPPLPRLARLYEEAAGWISPARVVGIELNTYDLDDPAARAAVQRAERECGLPATDAVRFGAGPLADAVLAAARERREDRAPAS
jgi:uncharacterized NAD-dependent epimerase/dehydratase family protein